MWWSGPSFWSRLLWWKHHKLPTLIPTERTAATNAGLMWMWRSAFCRVLMCDADADGWCCRWVCTCGCVFTQSTLQEIFTQSRMNQPQFHMQVSLWSICASYTCSLNIPVLHIRKIWSFVSQGISIVLNLWYHAKFAWGPCHSYSSYCTH